MMIVRFALAVLLVFASASAQAQVRGVECRASNDRSASDTFNGGFLRSKPDLRLLGLTEERTAGFSSRFTIHYGMNQNACVRFLVIQFANASFMIWRDVSFGQNRSDVVEEGLMMNDAFERAFPSLRVTDRLERQDLRGVYVFHEPKGSLAR